MLEGSKTIGVFGAKNTPYNLYLAFLLNFEATLKKNCHYILKMPPQAKFFQNFIQKCHIWCLKRLQHFVKIGKNFNPIISSPYGFQNSIVSSAVFLLAIIKRFWDPLSTRYNFEAFCAPNMAFVSRMLKKFRLRRHFMEIFTIFRKKWPKNAMKTQNIGNIGCFSAPKAPKNFFDPLSTRYNGVLKIAP